MRFFLATLVALFFAVQSADARLRLGLAWGTDNRWLKTIAKGNIEWYHHWQDGPVPGTPKSVQWVPMFWGPSKWGLWNERKAEMRKNMPSRLLFLNEPDVESQSNVNPWYAAELFVQEMVPWQNKGVKVTSPQIVWDFNWMDTFMKELKNKGHKPDIMAIHWYGSYKDLSGLKKFVTKAYKRYGLPVWLTEYGVTAKSGASDAELANFLRVATSWLASKHYVKRAAWLGCFAINNPPDAFASNKNAFFNSNGSLRSMANWYVYSAKTKRSFSDSAAHVVRSPGMLRHLKGRNHLHHREIAANQSSGEEIPVVDDVSPTEVADAAEAEHCDKYCKLREDAINNAKDDDDLYENDEDGDPDSLID